MDVSIGRGTYFTDGGPNVKDWIGSKVTIGNYCSIAPEVTFLSGADHHLEYVTTSPFGRPATTGGAIVVGSDVWVGYRAILLSGVSVGHGAVIGAGSVVTKDVHPYAIVAGVPAKHLRNRFPRSLIRQLLEIAWWDWPEEKILRYQNLLCSPDVGGFVEAAHTDRPHPPEES